MNRQEGLRNNNSKFYYSPYSRPGLRKYHIDQNALQGVMPAGPNAQIVWTIGADWSRHYNMARDILRQVLFDLPTLWAGLVAKAYSWGEFLAVTHKLANSLDKLRGPIRAIFAYVTGDSWTEREDGYERFLGLALRREGMAPSLRDWVGAQLAQGFIPRNNDDARAERLLRDNYRVDVEGMDPVSKIVTYADALDYVANALEQLTPQLIHHQLPYAGLAMQLGLADNHGRIPGPAMNMLWMIDQTLDLLQDVWTFERHGGASGRRRPREVSGGDTAVPFPEHVMKLRRLIDAIRILETHGYRGEWPTFEEEEALEPYADEYDEEAEEADVEALLQQD
jgi:hypothetical protein